MSKLKTILDMVENHIFSIPGVSDEYPGRIYVKKGETASSEWQQYQLEEFQGAFLIIFLQNWTGNLIAKSRARQQRFSRLVAVSESHPSIDLY